MIELYVNDQTLRMYTPVIAADTLHYLTGAVHFTGGEWDGYSKWIHFAQGEGLGATEFDVALSDDAWDESAELNLTVGEWAVFVTGTSGESRLTTVPLILTVKESGLIDAPLHAMPLSVAEQIDAKAATALSFAAEVKAKADAGEFDGKSFTIRGFYDTYAELLEEVPEPETGSAYGVGTVRPYDIYVWDAVNSRWINYGAIQGMKGDAGPVFTPSLDTSGNLSWTNDGGLPNPTTRNIRGQQGADGAPGADGKGPYETAVEEGYTGTKETFNAALVAIPYHNARHLPGGADPITVQTGNLAGGAVTRPKLANGAVSTVYTGTITTTWFATQVERTQVLSPDGSTTTFTINAAPASLIRVALATAPGEDVGGYTYANGILTFAIAPQAGSNTYIVYYYESGAPYSQTLAVQGLLETDHVMVDAVLPLDTEQAEAIQESYNVVYRMATADNALTVYASEPTSVAVPIMILAVSK